MADRSDAIRKLAHQQGPDLPPKARAKGKPVPDGMSPEAKKRGEEKLAKSLNSLTDEQYLAYEQRHREREERFQAKSRAKADRQDMLDSGLLRIGPNGEEIHAVDSRGLPFRRDPAPMKFVPGPKSSASPPPQPRPVPAEIPAPQASQGSPVPSPGLFQTGTKSLRDDIAPYYANIPGGVDARIAAATSNIQNRKFPMEGWGTSRPEDYSRPIPVDQMDPRGEFRKGVAGYNVPGDTGPVHMSPRYFPEGENTPRDGQMGWNEVLKHERGHRVYRSSPDQVGQPTEEFQQFWGGSGDTMLSKSEISARGAEIGQLYSLYNGIPVNTPEDALDALHWYIKNGDKIKNDGHRPTVTPMDAKEWLLLPGVKKQQVLQRMTETAGTNQLRRSLMS